MNMIPESIDFFTDVVWKFFLWVVFIKGLEIWFNLFFRLLKR
jgi:hypothetical protein